MKQAIITNTEEYDIFLQDIKQEITAEIDNKDILVKYIIEPINKT